MSSQKPRADVDREDGDTDPDEAGEAAQHEEVFAEQPGQKGRDPGNGGWEVDVAECQMIGRVEEVELIGKVAVGSAGQHEDEDLDRSADPPESEKGLRAFRGGFGRSGGRGHFARQV
jgi:hypothetical protein